MWHVGQRVVCVDDVFPNDDGRIKPVKGCVYTIRKLGTIGGIDGCWLKEITNPVKMYYEGRNEAGFALTRFNPLDEKRLDIFRKMLTVKEREKEIVE